MPVASRSFLVLVLLVLRPDWAGKGSLFEGAVGVCRGGGAPRWDWVVQPGALRGTGSVVDCGFGGLSGSHAGLSTSCESVGFGVEGVGDRVQLVIKPPLAGSPSCRGVVGNDAAAAKRNHGIIDNA